MTTQHEVIGYSTADLIDAMSESGIHCSLDRFKRLAIEIQRRAIATKCAESPGFSPG